ncbi:MAG: hypothetical protein KJ002_05600 [Candidatus Dadabacteria bacterium]|jgi:hypothetical protein|nr:hypothetical protein [Candidatus Dadabacteria bacterium]
MGKELLSILFKPFLRGRGEIKAPAEIGNETAITLSMMESGCIFVFIEGSPVLILKCSGEDMEALKESDAISLGFELLDRPEFPCIAVTITVDSASGRQFRFDYYFSLESEDEKGILGLLSDRDYFDILYYDDDIEQVRRAALTDAQRTELRSLIAGYGV